MKYKNAAQYSQSAPCTNVPIHCLLCPLSESGTPYTIWKYNTLFHLASEHAEDGKMPAIPSKLIVDMFISLAEEGTMGIRQEVTRNFRARNAQPDSEAVAEIHEQLLKEEEEEESGTIEAGSGAEKRSRAESNPQDMNSSVQQRPPVRRKGN